MKQYIEHFKMYDRDKAYDCIVPCSVYKTLIDNKAIEDPFYGENERISTPVCDRDFIFESEFELGREILSEDRLMLVFEGLDTLTDIYLNDVFIACTDNMHRRYEFDIKAYAKAENLLKIIFRSPNEYVRGKNAKRQLYGVEHSMEGYQYLRKAHCMFGWDWGPKLPDMGIWRKVYVESFSSGRIENVYYTQKHEEQRVVLSCFAALDIWDGDVVAGLTVTSPGGKEYTARLKDGRAEIVIDNPMLWWVRGIGEQPLYTCRLSLTKNGEVLDEKVKRIGLRTLGVSQEKDEWGEEFCFINNGVKIFAMGANYIPEDQIVVRCSKERTEKLLKSCINANYNFIRVWGGGYYPDDYFYDFCDENGIIVWQDFMFACAAYLLSPEFEATVKEEVKDNIIRLRNHASLGLWCGNNEIESAWEGWGWNNDAEAKADYLKLFENIIPSILKAYDPETFYWPSSPSSGGGFKNSSSNEAGDMHYWAVWHNFRPIEDFRKYYYRFCSEYGFESLPDIKTIRSFAEEKDFDLCGNVMQAHQKCTLGNEKLMYYLAQMVNYPYDFERLVYCSQLVQADCIRSNVEHMRRSRGRCMGSAYWQVNDSNPVISWSSIDYFGRWKALHYYAKRFYAPLLISCDDTDPAKPVLYVVNDTMHDEKLSIRCRLRDNTSRVYKEYETEAVSPALSSAAALTIDLADDIVTVCDKRTKYIEYSLCKNGEIINKGTTLFVRPKEFEFLPADVSFVVTEDEESFRINISSNVYTKSVFLSLSGHDVSFSDNFFDIHGSETLSIGIPRNDESFGRTGIDREIIEKELLIRNY
ncbi:MAG: glycoside hydrolase family 2 protein [Lachnospiraceae bacterium]|nr:glycoside hydrolase family 2 protein [Lachnospiraceae bacterium]